MTAKANEILESNPELLKEIEDYILEEAKTCNSVLFGITHCAEADKDVINKFKVLFGLTDYIYDELVKFVKNREDKSLMKIVDGVAEQKTRDDLKKERKCIQ